MLRRILGLTVTILAASAALAGGQAQLAAGATAGPAGAERAMGTLTIQRLGNGTITSTPAGINCGPGPTETACSANFADGTNITLRAAPIIGWAWNYWDGACNGRTTPTCTFRLTGSASVLVIFVGVDNAKAEFKPTWSNSRLSGTLEVSGVASHEAQLTFTLFYAGARIASGQVTVPSPGGNFQASIPLRDLKVLPGKRRFLVRMTGTVSNRQIPGREIFPALPVPREGIVDRAWITPLGSKKPVIRLPRGAIGAEAHFQFAYRPAPGTRITTTWFQGRIKLGTSSKPRGKFVTSRVGRAGGLPRGFFYRCELRVNGVLVKEVGVKTG